MLVSSREKSVPFLVNPFPPPPPSFSLHSYWMVMESYDCDLWRRYTWETAKFRFYGRPAYRGARQWTAKCTYGAVLPPNNDTRKRRKSPWGPMGPSPVPRDSRFFFFFFPSPFFFTRSTIYPVESFRMSTWEGVSNGLEGDSAWKKWKSSGKGILSFFFFEVSRFLDTSGLKVFFF